MTDTKDLRARMAALAGGAVLVLLGVLFLLNNFYHFLDIRRTWPLFMLIPVIPLAIQWIEKGRAAAGAVIPITILTFYCGHFLWLAHSSWAAAGTSWPNYLIGPGLGFLFLFLIERRAGLLVPAFVLLGLGTAFYSGIYGSSLPLGGFLVLAGVILVIGSRKS
ncbi:MAG: hypothetical protein MUF02_01355 [Acidobacteria bacterium]|jgi:hypothetical protein|nr:hypothetical protein [Acidobacteriota bacterium]